MKLKSIFEALIPFYGASARFRMLLRIREFLRIHHMIFFAKSLKTIIQYGYGCEISINAQISPKVSFMHTVGTVIGEGVVIEPDVTLYGGICLGRKNPKNDRDYPHICRGVTLCAGAYVLGNVCVNENAIVAAKALVLHDCESNGVYAGVPAIRIK